MMPTNRVRSFHSGQFNVAVEMVRDGDIIEITIASRDGMTVKTSMDRENARRFGLGLLLACKGDDDSEGIPDGL